MSIPARPGARRRKITADLPTLREFQGTLGASPKTLADALEMMSRLDKELTRLYVYASMLSDQDTRLSGLQGMQQEMQQLFAKFGAEASFVEPEILNVGRPPIEKYRRRARLKPVRLLLRDIFRSAAHTLSDAEEKIRRRDRWPVRRTTSTRFLTNADFPYPTITLKDGRRKVDQAGYSELRTSPVRDDRKTAMSSFFGALGGFGRTLGMTMNSSVQRALFYSRSRKLEQPRGGAERPERPGVGLHASRRGREPSLPTFHRYLRLRKRMMGITDDLHYYDCMRRSSPT